MTPARPTPARPTPARPIPGHPTPARAAARKSPRRRVAVIAVVVAALAAAGLAMTRPWSADSPVTLPWAQRDETPPPAPPRPVVTETVTDVPAFQLAVPGVIAASTEAVLAFETLGTIIERPVDVGDEVASGQVLARLDPDDLQADVSAARAALASAEVQLATARSAAERTRALKTRDVTSQAQLENAERALAAAAAARRQADSELARALDALGSAQITAPFEGLVSAVHRNPGSVVSAGEPVLTVASLHEREAVIDLPEAQLAGLQPGAGFTVVPDSDPTGGVPARVVRIEPLADAATRTRRVHLALDEPAGFRLGSLIRASRGRDDGAMLTLPEGALVRSDDGAQAKVWVVTRSADAATVSLRDVTTGPGYAGRVLVTEGIQPGDEVVIRGVHSLKEGQPVGRAVEP